MIINTDTIISLKNISIGYEGVALMPPLNLSINRSEFWGIVGPNGAGKSTLIKTILNIIPTINGKVSYPNGTMKFGYVPQRKFVAQNYPLTSFDVALMGRYGKKIISKITEKDKNRGLEEFDRIGISDIAYKQFHSLSGGQQQRVLIARSLCGDPDILILDEPTSGMDLPSEKDILTFLKSYNKEKHMTIIMISHQLTDVIDVSSHICFMNQEKNLFYAASKSEIVNEKTLKELYNRDIKIIKSNGNTEIFVKEG